MASGGHGHGRGRGRPNPATTSSSAKPTYRTGLSSSSDDDDLEMYGTRLPAKPFGQSPKASAAQGSPGKSRRPGTAGNEPTLSPTAQGQYFFSPIPKGETKGWGSGPRPSMNASSSTSYSGSHSQSFTATSGAGSSKYVGTKTALRNSLPTIPDVNKERALAAVKTLNTTWNNGIRDIFVSGIAKTLRGEFRDAKNPYTMALYLMAHSMDYFTPKSNTNTLPQEIIKEFKKWVQEFGGASLERQYLKPDMQLVCFNVICMQNIPTLMKLVFEVFRLDQIKSDLIVHIKKLCAEGKYKTACSAATYLGLFTQFEIHDFVVPLLLQDRESVATEYIQGSEATQTSLIAFLDGVLGDSSPSYTLRQYIMDNKIDQVKHEKLDIKPLTKLVGRLTQRFKMNVLDCPNVGKKKKLGALRHLMHRRFTNKEPMSDPAFYEMVDSVIQNDTSLAEEAIYYLRTEGEIVAAAKFALRHAVPLTNIAYEVQLEMAKINPKVAVLAAPPQQEVQSWDEDWDIPSPRESKHATPAGPSKSPSPVPNQVESKKLRSDSFDPISHVYPIDRNDTSLDATIYYKSRLPVTSIQILDTTEGIDIFLQHLKAAQMSQSSTGAMSSGIVVGIDCEWKPMMSAQPGVALIQVAIADDIFLIDMCKLRALIGNKTLTERSEALLQNFFANERILKIGYGLQSDLRMLSRSLPAWAGIQSEFRCILDLASLSKELLKINAEFYPFPGSGAGGGLSELVRCCTSLTLNKEDQFSDWEKRPLRESQIIYAATDAYCLLDVFEMMKRRALELGINFEELVRKFVIHGHNASVKGDRKKLSRTEIISSAAQSLNVLPPESPFVSPRSVSEIKLVCDNMLQGLGKQLRCCGIDTLILSNLDSHTRAAHYALQENRCIVTSGKIHQQLSSYVPIGHCFSVSAEPLVDQLREVLTYFNVIITNADIHSRCQCCNANSFHKVSGLSMKEMVWLYGHHRSHSHDFRKTESGSLEIEEDPVPSSSPLVNVMAQQDSRGWKILPESDLIPDVPNRVLKTPSGATVGLSSIPGPVLDLVDYFYVCTGCGKCYWIGSHYRKILEGKAKVPVPSSTVQDVNSRNDAANKNV